MNPIGRDAALAANDDQHAAFHVDAVVGAEWGQADIISRDASKRLPASRFGHSGRTIDVAIPKLRAGTYFTDWNDASAPRRN